MLSVQRLISLLLLALWWPATVHCEIASVIGAHDSVCHAPATTDKTADHPAGPSADNCESVENGDYRAEQSTLELAPAASVLWTFAFVLIANDHAAEAEIADRFVGGAHAQAWLPTRHFERRSAPSPRAPSPFLA